MPHGERTKSELLFQELCDQHNVVCQRLPECDDRKQPDYEIQVSHNLVVAEVKQIEPNADDKRFTDKLW